MLPALNAISWINYAVDGIAILAVIIFAGKAANKGFVKCFFKFISTIVAIIVAFLLMNAVLQWTGGLFGLEGIIKDGYTSVIECTAEDYNDPQGYQIVLREFGDKALMIVHTFKNGAYPPVEKYLADWKIAKTFGSDLDVEFRGRAYLLER